MKDWLHADTIGPAGIGTRRRAVPSDGLRRGAARLARNMRSALACAYAIEPVAIATVAAATVMAAGWLAPRRALASPDLPIPLGTAVAHGSTSGPADVGSVVAVRLLEPKRFAFAAAVADAGTPSEARGPQFAPRPAVDTGIAAPAPVDPPTSPGGSDVRPDEVEKKQDGARDAAGVGAENAPAEEEISPRLEQAVRKGLEFLRHEQKPDGSFGQGRYGEHIGVSSLGAIAMMADGNLPGRGDFGDCVRKALDFVLSHSTETGLLVSDETHGPMYGHGFATLFLGEIYGMNQQDDRVRDALVRAVQLIVSSQNDEGGWRYNPVPADADVSVTICQVMGLRSARNAGIKVPKTTIDDAIRYVRGCQNDDGGFRYMKEVPGSAWPRTAAGVATLFYAGIYDDRSIDRGLDYLMANAFPRGGRGGVGLGAAAYQAHYFYGQYYAVQAMYLAGGERWRKWWPAIRDELLARQNDDGSWSDPSFGDAYGTSMALIVLQMPKRYLPIFQR